MKQAEAPRRAGELRIPRADRRDRFDTVSVARPRGIMARMSYRARDRRRGPADEAAKRSTTAHGGTCACAGRAAAVSFHFISCRVISCHLCCHECVRHCRGQRGVSSRRMGTEPDPYSARRAHASRQRGGPRPAQHRGRRARPQPPPRARDARCPVTAPRAAMRPCASAAGTALAPPSTEHHSRASAPPGAGEQSRRAPARKGCMGTCPGLSRARAREGGSVWDAAQGCSARAPCARRGEWPRAGNGIDIIGREGRCRPAPFHVVRAG
ncbi:hypothetical protein BC834DRAFT_282331 [Gloeopeniophorella convolvens]|nr:hypothetical protein BC834DRAFT_282331 [Gloeopeniophorella convolvens]